MSQESLRQVDYDYKNRLEGMMRQFNWMLLVVLAFSVYAGDEKAVVIRSAEELKGITVEEKRGRAPTQPLETSLVGYNSVLLLFA